MIILLKVHINGGLLFAISLRIFLKQQRHLMMNSLLTPTFPCCGIERHSGIEVNHKIGDLEHFSPEDEFPSAFTLENVHHRTQHSTCTTKEVNIFCPKCSDRKK
jgi:hypothetical protein